MELALLCGAWSLDDGRQVQREPLHSGLTVDICGVEGSYVTRIQLAGVFLLSRGPMSCQKAHNTVVTTKLINSSMGPNMRPPTEPKLILATITTAKKIP